MSDAQRYRENAVECDRLAVKSVGEATRAAFRKMAAEWRALAADAEKREGLSGSPPPTLDAKETR